MKLHGGITVFLLDRYAATRAGVRQELEGSGFSVVGESDSAEEAIAQVAQLKPQVLLMDVELEEARPMEVLRRVRSPILPARKAPGCSG